MTEFGFVSDTNKFVPEYMPAFIRIDRTEGLEDIARVTWLGTVFVVGVQMLFTAKHVATQLLHEDSELNRGVPGQKQYAVIQVINGRQQAILWNIHSIGMIDNCDIALITLTPAHENAKNYLNWSGLPLTFIPPHVGDQIFGSGIHEIKVNSARLNAGAFYCDIDVRRSFSIGTVKDIHFEYRDRGMYSFPCMHVNAQFNPGMSGGYVLNERNEVCGVICGSLPPMSPEEEHASYASLLWPVVSLPVPHLWMKNADPNASYALWHYYHQTEIKPIGLERVTYANKLEQDGLITATYTDPVVV